MTDEQIRIELARRVMGWKIAPDEGREEWVADAANYPCLWVEDELVMLDIGDIFGDPWNPFSSWDDAMELAGKWADKSSLRSAGVEYGFDVESRRNRWSADADDSEHDVVIQHDSRGCRAVALAIARAVGIEVEK